MIKKTKCLSKKEKLFKKLGLRRSCIGLSQKNNKEKEKASKEVANFQDSLEEFLPGYNWMEKKLIGKHSMPRKSTPDSTQHQQCSSSEIFENKKERDIVVDKKHMTMKESNLKEKDLNNMNNEQDAAINLSGTDKNESEVHSTEDGNQSKMNVLGKRKSPFHQTNDDFANKKLPKMQPSPTAEINGTRRMSDSDNQSTSSDMNNDVICLSDRDKEGVTDCERVDKIKGSKEFQSFNSQYMSLRQEEEDLVLEITERKETVHKIRMELASAEEKLEESLMKLSKVEKQRRQMEVKHEERMAKLKSSATEDIQKKNMMNMNMNMNNGTKHLNNVRSPSAQKLMHSSQITVRSPPLPPPTIPNSAQLQFAEAMTSIANIQQKLPNHESSTKERQVQEAVKVAEGRRMQNFTVPNMPAIIANRFMQPGMGPMGVMGQQQWRPPPVNVQQMPRKLNGIQGFPQPNQLPVSLPQAAVPPSYRACQTNINPIAAVSPQPNQPPMAPQSPQMKSPRPRSTKEGEEEKKKPACDRCSKEANYLCSNCKKIWYCSSTCQYSSWEAHSRFCLKAN